MPACDQDIFERVADHYSRASQAASIDARREWPSLLCGRRVTIGLAGAPLLEAMEPTFRHLFDGAPEDPQGGPQISLWDCRATGVGRVSQAQPASWSLKGDGWEVSAYAEGRYLCENRPATQLWLDRATGRFIGCYEDSRTLNRTACARPFFSMMSILCRSLSAVDVHAALVGCDGRAALIVGGGGRGKSTSAIDGLHGGLDFLGDDSVAIGRDSSGAITGYSLYASARVHTGQCARWPAFRNDWLAPRDDEEKALLLPALHRPNQMRRSARIVAVVIPHVVGRGLAISRCRPIEAVHAMLHESRENRRFGLVREDFTMITDMVKELPCYRFEVDEDPDRVSEGLRLVISGEGP